MKTKSFFIAPAIIALFAFSTTAQNHPRATANSILDQSRNHGNGAQPKDNKIVEYGKATNQIASMPKFNLCPYPFGGGDSGPVRTPEGIGNKRR